MSDLPKISFIIPTLHFKRPLNKRRIFIPRYTLKDVIHDIENNVKVKYEIIIVCNGQEPELVDFVTSHKGITRYCLNNVNVGVARAWNMGAQMAESDVLCFVNDDVEIGAGGVEKLYEVLCSNDDIGQVGPRGSRWSGAEHECYVGETSIEEADAISGFFFMLRSNIYHELGGFDVNYSPAGFEEIDMSFKIRRAGKRCLVIPNVPIKHHYHHGVSAYNSIIKYLSSTIDTNLLHEKNKKYFMEKWIIK